MLFYFPMRGSGLHALPLPKCSFIHTIGNYFRKYITMLSAWLIHH